MNLRSSIVFVMLLGAMFALLSTVFLNAPKIHWVGDSVLLITCIANFVSAFYVMRSAGGRIDLAVFSAAVFAAPLVFLGAEPHWDYRFAFPLVLYFFAQFLMKRHWQSFLFAGYCLLGQYYLSGSVALLALSLGGFMLLAYSAYALALKGQAVIQTLAWYAVAWIALDRIKQIQLLLQFLLILLLSFSLLPIA